MFRLIESPEERRKRYLTCAEEAKSFAARYPNPDTRDAYLKLSQTWATMAEEIETRERQKAEPWQHTAPQPTPA